jgi:hypothetical protein
MKIEFSEEVEQSILEIAKITRCGREPHLVLLDALKYYDTLLEAHSFGRKVVVINEESGTFTEIVMPKINRKLAKKIYAEIETFK